MKDLNYKDRLEYLRNKENLPDEVVFETQDKIVEFLSEKDTFLAFSFLGSQKIRRTVFITLRLKPIRFSR